MPLTVIGRVRTGTGGCRIEVDEPYRAGLDGLEAFGWAQVLWWAHRAEGGTELACCRPYRGGPERLGVFATRTVQRPNPIGLSAVRIQSVDIHRGLLALDWVDCEDGTPLLDLKPYHPSADRVASPRVPAWCAHWPVSIEASAAFDWDTVFPG